LEKDDLMAAFQSPTPAQMQAAEEPSQEPTSTPKPTDTPTPTETVEAASVEPNVAENAVLLAVVPTETPVPDTPTPAPTTVPPTPTTAPPIATATPEAVANVMGSARAAAPTVKVYDMNGLPRDLDWANRKYGAWIEFAQPSAGTCFRLVEMRERSGPSNIDVWLKDENGNPIPNMTVRFDWPGDEVVQATNAEGKVGFPLGRGSYIYDARVGGPHTIKVLCEYPSDVARNMGHLAGTPHDHLDITFQLVRQGS
jgi:hypothetical protein